jgi:predicted transcriptional regulator
MVGEKRDGKKKTEKKCGGFHRPELLQITPATRTRKKAAAIAALLLDRAAELLDAIEAGLDGLEIGRVTEAHDSVARLSCPSPATPR